MEPARIPESFPAPSHRGNQRQALRDIRDAFAAGNDVVLVRAPTGSGKSLLARAVAGAARTVEEAEPAQATGAYYTTPQVSQLDDVAEDELLEHLQVIRGKSNYTCILPGEETTPVDRAPCARERGYDCSVQHRCPYYAARAVASNRAIAATTLAYFMRTAGSDVFRKRDVVVIDEAHGLAEWAEMYATIDISPRTVPVWDDVRVPDVTDADDTVERTVRFAESLAGVCERAVEELRTQQELSPQEAARRDRLAERKSELAWFVRDARDPESPTTWVVDQPDGAGGAISITPLDPARYLRHTVWDRGNKFALLSATILDKRSFCRGVGLDPADVALVEVGHTFPVENRPLFDTTCGKMTYDHRDETAPEIARLCVRLMAHHPDEKGLIHAHSYDIARRLASRFADAGVGPRVRTHGRHDRDEQLAQWQAADEPEVFVSVKMEEALDLKGDRCRWQVLCKAPYRNTSDSTVARRLKDDQWGWYYRTALRTVIQACGRVVRAPDDYGATYLADASLLELFDRAATDMPPWFQDQIDRLSEPSLPAFDPDAALSGVSATPAAGRVPRGGLDVDGAGSAGATGAGGGGSTASGGSGGGGSAGGSSSGGRDRDGSDGRAGADDEDDELADHPLSDVWG
ncbi:helicase C-terminal domain-containing protein [Halobaculum sp. MBLA0147]|uniref:helicase C-terminal domain-containing protein n=1 Tax=Halobaculum sp. MBLA0147 TaxID=3079934 RepID=UPI0035241E1B